MFVFYVFGSLLSLWLFITYVLPYGEILNKKIFPIYPFRSSQKIVDSSVFLVVILKAQRSLRISGIDIFLVIYAISMQKILHRYFPHPLLQLSAFEPKNSISDWYSPNCYQHSKYSAFHLQCHFFTITLRSMYY